MKKRILISAGESSGDQHASKLIRELLKLDPDIEFFGIGCDRMEASGVRLLERMDRHAIVGVWEVVANIGFIKNLFDSFKKRLDESKTDLAILIDYPGFNLALAKMLASRKIPCVYYITPQIWAWGMWRIRSIRKYVKKAIVILNFEEALYKKLGVDATFVGHPLLDDPVTMPAQEEARARLGLEPDKHTIALLPGSRPLEVKRILPVLIQTCAILGKQLDTQFVISRSPNVDSAIYEEVFTAHGNPRITVTAGGVTDCLAAADFVITASGTVTLQVAMAEKPMIITYITSMLTYLLGKIFVRTRIGLVNIIAGEDICPEILQFYATPDALAREACAIISSDAKRGSMISGLRRVKKLLGEPGAAGKAAGIINHILAGR
ncbi:MAG: lipid-A-disaccharide synthase [Candidatus Omnitrophota bacterium]